MKNKLSAIVPIIFLVGAGGFGWYTYSTVEVSLPEPTSQPAAQPETRPVEALDLENTVVGILPVDPPPAATQPIKLEKEEPKKKGWVNKLFGDKP